jgi:ribonuclease PH
MPYKDKSVLALYKKRWDKAHRPQKRAATKAWKRANRGAVEASRRRRRSRHSAEVTPAYARHLLACHSNILRRSDIPNAVVEVKQTIIKLKRLCQNQKI